MGTAPSLNSRLMNGPFDATPASSARAFLWIGTATVTGAIVMTMEFTTFRLYAPYFGNSEALDGKRQPDSFAFAEKRGLAATVGDCNRAGVGLGAKVRAKSGDGNG